ncbi:MAG: helix-turn-helix domain-containing protein [Deltaproteobacteria bacterium]|nr:helix-turn-helix domain-containing protein [Deltaproteobacteria bacterium]
MERLGEFLKEAREARGLSIEDISRITRINLSMLRALEDSDLEMLPAHVIARGFIRSYCKVVGISDYKALELYDGEVEPPDAEMVDRLRIRDSDRSMKWVFIGVILVVIILGIVLFVYSGWNRDAGGKRSSSLSVSRKKTVSDTQPSGPVVVEPGEFSGDTSPEWVQTPVLVPPQENEFETQGEGSPPSELHLPDISEFKEEKVKKGNKPEHVLVLEAKEITWVQREIDDGPPRDVTLHPGDKIVMRARNRISLYIGNAGGVNLTFNGKPINNLGPSGNVVYITLPAENGKPRN